MFPFQSILSECAKKKLRVRLARKSVVWCSLSEKGSLDINEIFCLVKAPNGDKLYSKVSFGVA